MGEGMELVLPEKAQVSLMQTKPEDVLRRDKAVQASTAKIIAGLMHSKEQIIAEVRALRPDIEKAANALDEEGKATIDSKQGDLADICKQVTSGLKKLGVKKPRIDVEFVNVTVGRGKKLRVNGTLELKTSESDDGYYRRSNINVDIDIPATAECKAAYKALDALKEKKIDLETKLINTEDAIERMPQLRMTIEGAAAEQELMACEEDAAYYKNICQSVVDLLPKDVAAGLLAKE